MKKRRSTTYVEPTTLADLRRIVTDYENWPATTRLWVRHSGDPALYFIEVSHGSEEASTGEFQRPGSS